MYESLQNGAENGREGSKRKSNRLESASESSEDESNSTAAMLPVFKKQKNREEWMMHEESNYAQFSGERLFEGHSPDRELQQQVIGGIKYGISIPDIEHAPQILQSRKKNKAKSVSEEDEGKDGGAKSSRDDFHLKNPWIESMRTCMRECMQEIAESRQRFLKWMREEIQNFMYREKLASGLEMPFPGQESAGVGYGGGPEMGISNIGFVPRVGGDSGLRFEGQGCAIREQSLDSEHEGMKFVIRFPDSIALGSGRKLDEGQHKTTKFGSQSIGDKGTIGMQTHGNMEGMRIPEQRGIYLSETGGHQNVIGGMGQGRQDIGTGQSFSGNGGARENSYEFAGTSSSKLAHVHDLGCSLGCDLQNSRNVARMQGALTGGQNPVALGVMWNMMQNAAGGNSNTFNHGIVNYSSAMANKAGNDVFLGNYMGYESHMQAMNSLIHGGNSSMGMQLPIALQTLPPVNVQSLVGLPSAAGGHSPASMQSLMNLGMTGSNLHGVSAMCGQFFPSFSENLSLEKPTSIPELVTPTSVKKNHQSALEHGFDKSRA